MSRQGSPRAGADADRTARARIRDAAIERFASQGFSATSLKDVAADAGVSTSLVLHHFGSKDDLRAACDNHVASLVRHQKSAGMAAGPGADPFETLRGAYEGTSIFRYVARALAEGSPHLDDLVDTMVEDALVYMADGVERGVLRPVENLREQVVVLSVWQLGALAMNHHLKRLLGIDLVDGTADSLVRWAELSSRILAKGVINEEVYDELTAGTKVGQRSSDTSPDPRPAAREGT